jgi:DNA polymerase (family 10)
MPVHNADIARAFDELAEGRELPKLPGIGADLAGKMAEVAARGTCKLLEQLRRKFPPGITELLTLPGLGPKRVRALIGERIGSLADLERAAREGRLRCGRRRASWRRRGATSCRAW